jgi:hypothetical protein
VNARKKRLPKRPIKNGYEKTVPRKICENTVLNMTMKKSSLKLNIEKPRQTGMFDKPSRNMGTGTGMKFSNMAINADRPEKYANLSLFIVLLRQIPHFRVLMSYMRLLYWEDK